MKKIVGYLLIAIVMTLSACHDNSVTSSFQFGEPEHILTGYFVQSITFDHEGTAWIGTLKQGLLKYDTKPFHFDSSNSILPDSFSVGAMDIDNLGRVWIGSNIGLMKYDNNKFTKFDKSNSPIKYYIYALSVDHNNSVWFTNGNIYNGGLVQYDNEKWNVYTPENSQLTTTVIYDIEVDNENNKWFVCNGAVIKYKDNHWTYYMTENTGINMTGAHQITFSNFNELWVLCDFSWSSVAYLDEPTVLKFDKSKWSIQDPPDFDSEISMATAIYSDSKGRVWLARGYELMYYYLGKWNYCCKVPSIVFAIKERNNNQIWLGTGNGIYIINEFL